MSTPSRLTEAEIRQAMFRAFRRDLRDDERVEDLPYVRTVNLLIDLEEAAQVELEVDDAFAAHDVRGLVRWIVARFAAAEGEDRRRRALRAAAVAAPGGFALYDLEAYRLALGRPPAVRREAAA